MLKVMTSVVLLTVGAVVNSEASGYIDPFETSWGWEGQAYIQYQVSGSGGNWDGRIFVDDLSRPIGDWNNYTRFEHDGLEDINIDFIDGSVHEFSFPVEARDVDVLFVDESYLTAAHLHFAEIGGDELLSLSWWEFDGGSFEDASLDVFAKDAGTGEPVWRESRMGTIEFQIVPEPSMCGLMSVGILGLGWVRRLARLC